MKTGENRVPKSETEKLMNEKERKKERRKESMKKIIKEKREK